MAQTTPHSLLQRLKTTDNKAWLEFAGIYSPFLRYWLGQRLRFPTHQADIDDLVQDVLQVVSQKVATFQHNGRVGAFRLWLKTIVRNRASEFLRHPKLLATGDSDFAKKLQELEDPQSELHQSWDREHDAHVLNRLLEMARDHFSPEIWKRFEETALKNKKAGLVAAELQTTRNAVWLAKSGVLRWLREKARELVD